MSKDFIMSVMKRYCYDKSVTCDEIEYKRYNNFKTTNVKGHREYLFYGHKKPSNEVNYYCPLNYMGGKSPIIDFIKPNLVGRTYFVDLMGGGFNVGINATGFKHIIYNDINFAVVKLLRMFRDKDTAELLTFIERTIKKYGLEKKNKDSYNKIRTDYNQVYRGKSDEYKYLFIVILYGFQQQLRFNSQYEFNNPVGESGFSESVREKIISFSRRIKELDVDFHIGDYECISHLIDHDSLVYVDPPYLITLGSYNDGKRGFKGWNEKEELRLLNFLNSLIEKGCKIVLSNIFEHKGRTNDYLKQWTKRKRLTVQSTTYRGRNEVLIISQ